ncbi:hypothetical protein TSMEX_006409, partial [Taenia solium]
IQPVPVFVLHTTGLKYHRHFEGLEIVSLIEIILSSYLELPKPLLTWTFSEDLEEWTNDGDSWLHKWKVSSIRNQTLLCLQTKPTQQSRQSILLSRKKNAAKPNIQARLLSPPIPSDLSLRCLAITYTFNLGGRTSLFSCDFESPGMQSFCGWNIDPRDSGAVWGIVWIPNLHTNILCLTPAASSPAAVGVYVGGDDDIFDLRDTNETVMRAKFWSPKFRMAKVDAVPRCVKFLFKFGQPLKDSPLSLSLMFHSSR